MIQKALIYCRVSSKKQSTGGSGLTSQEKRCRQYAAQNGYQVEEVFPDDITGGSNFMKRKGIVALLEHINAHPKTSYTIIFDDLKRLARDTKYHLILRETLDALGVEIECLNFNFEKTPEGEFYETVIAAGGQLERQQGARQVSQKVIARFEAGY
jgi:DNA invertase Pin-like site-specific DNA recombinase